ncbi:hypothetical protein FA10DRAFT_42085 [Acaromyces ingoldii]|uniref:Zn(2)-C6 fungal-type domain-containing protein n=1 Tax=Acaromyces ingoldii TaxID=215250 RepID=A0A316YYG2_9BASI|nr:hypothetical protein FA10DRAFT_42085 [Acaromyces ingoldii]PWN94142.1 hypothetical protein FA10DRAFT_42085 [Acaromyces ingoldii]
MSSKSIEAVGTAAADGQRKSASHVKAEKADAPRPVKRVKQQQQQLEAPPSVSPPASMERKESVDEAFGDEDGDIEDEDEEMEEDDEEDDDDEAGPGRAGSQPAGSQATSATGKAPSKKSRDEKKISCLPCREAKIKCTIPRGAQQCERCQRSGKDCVFKTHKRGRRPGKMRQQQANRRWEQAVKIFEDLKKITTELGDDKALRLVQIIRSNIINSNAIPEPIAKLIDLDNEERRLIQIIESRKENLGGPHSSEAMMYAASPGRSGAKRKWSEHQSSSTHVLPHYHQQQLQLNHQQQSRSDRERSDQRVMVKKEGGTPLFENTVTRGFLGIPKSEAETSLMVDLEDEASVSEVPAHISSSSNPLKLLAHASVTRTNNGPPRSHAGEDSAAGAGSHRDTDHNALPRGLDGQESEMSTHFPRRGVAGGSVPSQTARRRAAQDFADKRNFKGSTFQPVYDHDPKYDPITRGRMTLNQASKLIDFFYDHFSNFIFVFDRQLSDLTYIRKHSCFLLTVMCAFAAFYHPDEEHRALHPGLTEWYEGLLPAMLSGGFKSVEISQACYVLASFEPFVNGAASDKSFLLLGTAIRMAGELGCNLRMYSYHLPKAFRQQTPESMTKHRQLKNTERLWLSLWLFERTLHLMTGQSLSLNEDGPTAVCLFWHRKPLSCPQDGAIVGLIELRRIVAQRQCYYEEELRHPLSEFLKRYTVKKREDDVQVSAMTRDERDRLEDVKIRYTTFRDRAIDSLRNWRKLWIGWSVEDSDDESSVNTTTTKTPLEATGELHYYIAVLLTLSLPLKDSEKVTPYFLQDSFRDCFDASLQLLTLFRTYRGMEFMSNNMIISATYSCIFALDLAFGGRADFPLPRSHKPEDIQDQCQELGVKLKQAGEKCINSLQSAAWQCGHYIETTLARIRAKHGEGEVKSSKRASTRDRNANPSAPPSSSSALASTSIPSLDGFLMDGYPGPPGGGRGSGNRQRPQSHESAWLGALSTSMAQESSAAVAAAAAVFGAAPGGNMVGSYDSSTYGHSSTLPNEQRQPMSHADNSSRSVDYQAEHHPHVYSLQQVPERFADAQPSSLLTPSSNGNSNQQRSVDSIFDLTDLGLGGSGMELGGHGSGGGSSGLGFDARADDGQFVPVLSQLNAMSFFINGSGQGQQYPAEALTPQQHLQHHHNQQS